jgi:hypothetical protein
MFPYFKFLQGRWVSSYCFEIWMLQYPIIPNHSI